MSEHLNVGRVDIHYISTHDIAVDGLTKSLSPGEYSKFVKILILS